MRKTLNAIWVALGFLAFGLGLLGVVLPVLPTTPFLLLAAALFAKGSEKFHTWFVETKIYQKYIVTTFQKRQLTKKAKWKALGMTMLFLSIGLIVTPIWYAKAIIAVVMVFHVYFFLFKIKTVDESVEQEEEYTSECE